MQKQETNMGNQQPTGREIMVTAPSVLALATVQDLGALRQLQISAQVSPPGQRVQNGWNLVAFSSALSSSRKAHTAVAVLQATTLHMMQLRDGLKPLATTLLLVVLALLVVVQLMSSQWSAVLVRPPHLQGDHMPYTTQTNTHIPYTKQIKSTHRYRHMHILCRTLHMPLTSSLNKASQPQAGSSRNGIEGRTSLAASQRGEGR